MAANKPGKAEILAAFFDDGTFSPLYADGAVSAAYGSANGQSVYVVYENGEPVGVQDIQKNIRVLEMAAQTGAPVVTFYDSIGAKLDGGLDLLNATAALTAQIARVSGVVPQILSTVGNFASNFVAVFTAVASSVYMLSSKDKLLHQLRTLTYAFLPRSVAQNTLRICHFANENFTGFFVGKVIDSAIIGVLTFALMSLLRLDFALLVSVFVGITNIIPVFGPFIGAIPSIFILLLVDPVQALIFAVLILFIQQLDGNFIGPKILGQSIGISSLWVLFSIVVGGDLFGLVGMVIGVPLFATLFGLLQEIVHFLLDRKGIDGEGNPVPGAAPETAAPAEPAQETTSVS